MARNTCAKRMAPVTAYEVWQLRDGTMVYVLKKYQIDDNAPCARWLVATTNPYNKSISAGSDTYAKDIMNYGVKVANPLATEKV